MAMFVARVELHGANAETYQRLHEAMQAIGFNRTITGDNGGRYLLPTGEYHHPASDMSTAGMEERVYQVALRHQPALRPPRNPMVIVTNGDSAWHLPNG